jgi:hypothetical protein
MTRQIVDLELHATLLAAFDGSVEPIRARQKARCGDGDSLASG